MTQELYSMTDKLDMVHFISMNARKMKLNCFGCTFKAIAVFLYNFASTFECDICLTQVWQIRWTGHIRRECAAANSNLQSASTLCQTCITWNFCNISPLVIFLSWFQRILKTWVQAVYSNIWPQGEETRGQFEFIRKQLSTDDGKWESRIWWLLPVLSAIDLEGRLG